MAVNTFPVPARRSISQPRPPHTMRAERRVALIVTPVDIPPHISLGSGLPAMEPAEYSGLLSAESKPGEHRFPWSTATFRPPHPPCENFHKHRRQYNRSSFPVG